MNSHFLLLALAAPLLLASPLAAEPVTVHGDVFDLPVPSGYCALEPERPEDRPLFDKLENFIDRENNMVALAFLPCGELTAIRSGRELYNARFGIWFVPAKKGEPRRFYGLDREEYVRDIAEFHQGKSGAWEGETRVENLEFDHATADIVFNKYYSKVKSSSLNLSAVVASTLVKGIPFSLFLASSPASPSTYAALRRTAETSVSHVIRAHDPEGAALPQQWRVGWKLIFSIIGGVLALGAAGLRALQR